MIVLEISEQELVRVQWVRATRMWTQKRRDRGLGMDTCTHNKDLLSGTENSSECYVAAWMGVGFGGEWIHVYIWLSPFTIHLKLSQHCCLAILQHKIKNF